MLHLIPFCFCYKKLDTFSPGENHNHKLRSMQYFGYHENILTKLVLPLKHFKNTWFAFSIKIICYFRGFL